MWILCILLFFVAFGRAPAAHAGAFGIDGRVVMLDPGHGGRDDGASGHGTIEANVNVAVARYLAADLSQAGAVVVLTRRDNGTLLGPKWRGSNRQRSELQSRVALSLEVRPDCYLSLHCNAWPGGGRARGAQVFLDPKAGPAHTMLGDALMRELKQHTSTPRGLSRRIDHYILKHVKVPVATVEMGFVSDAEEARLLARKDYQQKLAHIMFVGLMEYFTELVLPPQGGGDGPSAPGELAPGGGRTLRWKGLDVRAFRREGGVSLWVKA